MKIILGKNEKHSVRVSVQSTTSGGDLKTHDVNANGEIDLGDFDDETQIVLTRGPATAADESKTGKGDKKPDAE